MAKRCVFVAVKPVAPVLEVDWLTGKVRTDPRRPVRTPSDEAACAVGLAVAEALDAELHVIAVAGPAAIDLLRGMLAEGAQHATRIVIGGDDRDAAGPEEQWSSESVAAALALVVEPSAVVVCGDASGDRGSGTVPGRLAHLLGVPQALCLREVAVHDGTIAATRRLDGGRRERLEVTGPCVLSVEPSSGTAPRASLPMVLDAAGGSAPVDVVRVEVAAARRGDPPGTLSGPYRPRASDIPGPREPHATRRAVEVAGTLSRRDPPEVLRCDPDAAADAILERLERWGMR